MSVELSIVCDACKMRQRFGTRTAEGFDWNSGHVAVFAGTHFEHGELRVLKSEDVPLAYRDVSDGWKKLPDDRPQRRCPGCGVVSPDGSEADSYETTTKGFGDGQDDNDVTCLGCGWKGKAYEMEVY